MLSMLSVDFHKYGISRKDDDCSSDEHRGRRRANAIRHCCKFLFACRSLYGWFIVLRLRLKMPGGGFGIYDGCTQEWGATSTVSILLLQLGTACAEAIWQVWGAQYGGSSTDTCSQFPTKLQAGCQFRWGWFEGADNPTVEYEAVACPAALTDLSGCVRTGDQPTGPASVPTWTSGVGPSSTGTSTSTITSISTGTHTSTSAISTTTGSTGTSSCTSTEYSQCGGTGWTVRPQYRRL